MPDILLTRIDNRLVHGQVGVAWTSSLAGCNLIVVADDPDELAESLLDTGHKALTVFRLQAAGSDEPEGNDGI
jgi:PTS system galactosamine-specific IIB component